MLWYIIANPAAGNQSIERRWPDIERRLQEMGIAYTVQFTNAPGHAARLAEDAILNGHRHILGIGGDGTNHEIINGILSQSSVPSAEVFYALLPVGTGNDWAKTYNIPHDISQRLERLKNPQTRLQDAGKVRYHTVEGEATERWFVNVAGMAYDGFVAKRIEEDGKSNNQIEYLLAVGRYLFEYDLTRARISWDGAVPVEDFFYTINVGLCRYSGGGMQFVPQAIPDDGLLALTFARRLPRWEVLLQTPRFYKGTLLSHSKITGTQAQSVEVMPLQDDQPLWLEADGEFLGQCPAVFSIVEKAINVVL